MNIEGLYTRNKKDKLTQLREMATAENVAIIAVTESHLREELRSAEVPISGFQFQRADRVNSVKKSGVALYRRDDIAPYFEDSQGFSVNKTEFLCIYSANET